MEYKIPENKEWLDQAVQAWVPRILLAVVLSNLSKTEGLKTIRTLVYLEKLKPEQRRIAEKNLIKLMGSKGCFKYFSQKPNVGIQNADTV